MTTKQWTVGELAELATERGRKVTARHVRRLCRQGARHGGIDAEKLGRDWVVADVEARRWLLEWLGDGDRG